MLISMRRASVEWHSLLKLEQSVQYCSVLSLLEPGLCGEDMDVFYARIMAKMILFI